MYYYLSKRKILLDQILSLVSFRSCTIIYLNSSNDTSPSPFSSISFTICVQTSSLILPPTPSTSLISSVDIDPLPSLSYTANAALSFSSCKRLPRLTVAVTNSEKSISPLLSTSTNLNIRSTSVYAKSP